MCMSVLPTWYVCILCACLVPVARKELKLPTIVTSYVGTWTWTWVLWKSSHCSWSLSHLSRPKCVISLNHFLMDWQLDTLFFHMFIIDFVGEFSSFLHLTLAQMIWFSFCHTPGYRGFLIYLETAWQGSGQWKARRNKLSNKGPSWR